MSAYDTFADAANTGALKVVLQADKSEALHSEQAHVLAAH
jgi:predicted lipoprotein